MQLSAVIYLFFSLPMFFLSLGGGKRGSEKYFKTVLQLCFIVFFVVFFGFREFDVGTDTHAYLRNFTAAQEVGFVEAIFVHRFERGYSALVAVLSRFVDERFFLIALSALYSFLLSQVVKNKFEIKAYGLVLVFIMGYFLTVNMGVNLIRQGLAVPWLFLAYLSLTEGRRFQFILLVFLGSLFHFSSLLTLTLLVLYSPGRAVSSYILLWLFFAVVALLGLFSIVPVLVLETLRVDITHPHLYSIYTSAEEHSYRTGFRWDFLIFSSIPLLMFFLGKLLWGGVSQRFYELLKIFLVLNLLMFIAFPVPYSDRLALLSWSLLPLLIGSWCMWDQFSDDGKLVSRVRFDYFCFVFLMLALAGFASYLFYGTMQVSQVIL